jgi:protein gp37
VLCGIRTGSSGRATVPCTRNRAGWPGNVWVGTSVGTQASAEERIPHLLRVPARVRFLSVEPQLEEVDLSEWIAPASCCSQCGESYPGIVRDEDAPCGHDLITTWGAAQRERYFSGERYANGGPQARDEGPQIAWVIQGGESGPRARPFDLAWARSLRDQCKAAHVAYFLKQLGARPEADWKGWETGQTYERGVVRLRDSHGGGDESEWPADLRGCRAFPEVHP